MERKIREAAGERKVRGVVLHAWVTTCRSLDRPVVNEQFRLCFHIGERQIVSEGYDLQKVLRHFLDRTLPTGMSYLGMSICPEFDPVALGC